MRALTALVIALGCCTLHVEAGAKRKPRARRELISETGPSDELIWDSGLLEKTVSAANVYEKALTYYKDVAQRKFTGPVLAYVTPWHRRGYELAVQFRAKLTHVSPVWYQLKRDKSKEWVLQGGHEYNQTWLEELRAPVEGGDSSHRVKVVPRVIVELEEGQDHVDLVSDPRAAITAIQREVKARGYDGIVLEVWMMWVQMNGIENDGFRAAANAFVGAVGAAMREAGGQLVLAVPPAVPSGYSRPFTRKDSFLDLAPHVDAWSVMTYDYSVGRGPQPNAPLRWFEDNLRLVTEPDEEGRRIQRPSQVLMGLNFYGYDYALRNAAAPEAIISSTYLSLLAKHQPELVWEAEHEEHAFEYTGADGGHKVYYPSPRSLQMRLEAAAKAGAGVSIWELGQGIERFMDLL